MIEIASRSNRLPPPPTIVWGSLTEPHQPGARPWLRLLDDEVEPELVEAEHPVRVVWTSLWPARPRDQVHLDLADGGGMDTRVRFRLLTPDEPPDEITARGLRRRLSELLFADLRYSYGQ
ncbi:hypothetical protein [Nocardioides conyzicola]|uniref:SRPBCC family protein n=1 Tax=Nocardioides conyzicola TaxID=1651781 RepID=A0ABP8WZQ9_9ACTN